MGRQDPTHFKRRRKNRTGEGGGLKNFNNPPISFGAPAFCVVIQAIAFQLLFTSIFAEKDFHSHQLFSSKNLHCKSSTPATSTATATTIPSLPFSTVQYGKNRRRRSPIPNQKHSENYGETIECASKTPFWSVKPPRLEENSFLDDEESADEDDPLDYDDSSSSDTGSDDSQPFENNKSGEFRKESLPHSPVVYRFYGKHRSRGGRQYSIPFILFGPNVDHWKDAGKLLSMRGFNVMACERIHEEIEFEEENNHRNFKWRKRHKQTKPRDNSEDGPNLVLDILDAMSWDQVILVGCDSESLLTIETAMQLAPEKVAGLVLCGDLTEADRLASSAGAGTIDNFLRKIVDCPFIIIWEGDYPNLLKGSGVRPGTTHQSSDRVMVAGGGSAPHRRRPEQFAWVLSRFVEERLGSNYKIVQYSDRSKSQGEYSSIRIQLPFGLDELMSSEGRLIVGRTVATALFYIALVKVGVFQYRYLRRGLSEIKATYKSVDKVSRKVLNSVSAFVANYGYIPRLFRLKRVKEEDDEDGDVIIMTDGDNDDDSYDDSPDLRVGNDANKSEGNVQPSPADSSTDAEKPSVEEVDHQTDQNEDDNILRRFEDDDPYLNLDHVVT